MSSYWSQVCSAAEARLLQELLNDLYASGGVLVSRAPDSPNRAFSFFFQPCLKNLCFTHVKISAFIACAIALKA
jgi:hypothetical protein